MPKKVGRPLGLTEELAQQIANVLGRGSSRRTTAAKVGVPSSTLDRWMSQADAGREPYATLLRAALVAEADFLDGIESEIRRGVDIKGNEDWKARQALLRARLPAEWGQRIRIENLAQDWIRELVEDMRADVDAGTLSLDVCLGFMEWLHAKAGSKPAIPGEAAAVALLVAPDDDDGDDEEPEG
ncbi:MAG: hypothetical protein CMN30_08345 [Sandaracinus sp.]|nr:hypothetical protein [Sandaracinus sp.]